MGTKEHQAALKVSSVCANSSTEATRSNKKQSAVTSSHRVTHANNTNEICASDSNNGDKNHNKSITNINTPKSNQKAANTDSYPTTTTTTATVETSTAATTTLHHSKAQIIIIPATSASTVATNAAKKIRRAFSMPRNPFQWSRKFKTSGGSSGDSSHGGGGDDDSGGGNKRNSTLTACVGGGGGSARHGSVVSLNSYTIISKDTDGPDGGANAEVTATQAATQTHKKMHSARGNSTSGGNRVFRRSSLRKFLNRITQHVSSTINIGANKQQASSSANSLSSSDRVPPIGGYQWPADQTPGVTGLKNHGNTCFMNAVLQCLSHTDILAEYFVLDQYKSDLKRRNKINSRKFGTKGELTEQLANVLKALWTCRNESDHSTSFKAVVDRYGSQFRSSTQHDAQEFLFWLLDKVHEDLNTATKRHYKSVKNNYGRPDEVIAAETLANHIRCNNSFVQAVFQAQFRSSLTCPRCKKQSNTFDPFHCISVQLPQLAQQTVFVTVIYNKQLPRQVKLGLTVPAGSPIIALREQLHADTGIASDHMVLVDINETGFARVYYDTQPIATLAAVETIYCIEVPPDEGEEEEKEAKLRAGAASSSSSSRTCDDDSGNSVIVAAKTTTSTAKTKVSSTSSKMDTSSSLLLLVANVKRHKKSAAAKNDDDDTCDDIIERFGTPFCLRAPRDATYPELQKKLLREMSSLLKPEVFAYTTKLSEMFQIRLQDPSADPDTYLEQVEHPLLTEMIDLALSVLSSDAGPAHIKLLLEWAEPEQHFVDFLTTPLVVEHESVARLQEQRSQDTTALTLEQCLEHYTKAETLSAEDAWRCPQCQQYLPVVKTLGLWSLPDILVVHFKRFRQHQAKGSNAAKLTTMVKFPLNAFDMAPHLAKGTREPNAEVILANAGSIYGRPSPWKKSTRAADSRSSTLESNRRETRYDLYAVCYHQGDTLETGHYTAACKNPYDHQWYKFDDQRVSRVPDDSIEEEIISNEAYMLFYQRRRTDMTECSGSSSNSGEHWVSKIAPPPAQSAQNVEKVRLKTDSSTNGISAAATVALATKDGQNEPKRADSKPEIIPQVVQDHTEAVMAVSVADEQTEGDVKAVPENAQRSTLTDIESLKYVDDATEEACSNGDEACPPQEEDDKDAKMKRNKFHENDDNSKSEIISTSTEAAKEEATISSAVFVAQTNTTRTDCTADHTTTTTLETSPAANDLTKTVLSSPEDNRCTTGDALGQLTKSSQSLDSSSTHSLNPSTCGNASAQELKTNFTGRSSSATATFQDSPIVASSTTLEANKDSSAVSHKVLCHGHESAMLSSSSFKSSSSSFSAATATGIAMQSNDCQLSLQRFQQHSNGGSHSSVSVEQLTPQSTHNCLNLRHSFSTSSNYKLKECSDTLSSMLRNTANACSKDTLIFIDQQNHHHHHHHHNHHHNNHHSLMEDDDDDDDEDDDTFMGSRTLWISPVTPHKLITVSPKN